MMVSRAGQSSGPGRLQRGEADHRFVDDEQL